MSNLIHKFINISSAQDFSNFPEQIVSPTATSVTFGLLGYGTSFGNTGDRFWDTSIIPNSSVQTLAPNVPLILPFSKATLPTQLHDYILTVNISGTRYFYATSNSPDNITNQGTSSPSATNLFFLEPRTFGLNNFGGSNSTNKPFMAGGFQTVAGSPQPAKIVFLRPLDVTTTFTITGLSFPYVPTAFVPAPFSSTLTVLAGAVEANWLVPNSITGTGHPSGVRTFAYSAPPNTGGYISWTVNHNNPSLRSLLNTFHWSYG
jgi:hypothetical protein